MVSNPIVKVIWKNRLEGEIAVATMCNLNRSKVMTSSFRPLNVAFPEMSCATKSNPTLVDHSVIPLFLKVIYGYLWDCFSSFDVSSMFAPQRQFSGSLTSLVDDPG
eukprot:1855110-Amphidinium_carterae.1